MTEIFSQEHWKKLLPVIQAFADGETIEIKANNEWKDYSHQKLISFCCDVESYRIKPKMKVIKTRRALVHRPVDNELVVTIWSDSYSTTQEDWEQDPMFIKWIEDTQTHEIEI